MALSYREIFLRIDKRDKSELCQRYDTRGRLYGEKHIYFTEGDGDRCFCGAMTTGMQEIENGNVNDATCNKCIEKWLEETEI